ncbi:hypothetical protein DVH24_013583 [Malus domestica]|uniref:Uncharacterized protein n=1 Tax=Malus domestica TaxID=3750 RepID=A0A498JDV4_MALDO|nr:hypothetical protein DVH24_013583 [Malus domestica]
MMPRARLQEGVAGSRNTALRPERLILSFPPLAAEDVGNILKFCETLREVSRASKHQLLMVPRFGEPDLCVQGR